MSELNEFLKTQTAEGTRVSTGEFTVDLAKATDKFRRFQLADPAFYVLKLVQAAVVAEAKDMRFTFTRNEVKADFTPQRSVTFLDRLMDDLLTGAHADPAMVHLGKALAGALGAPQVFEVELTYRMSNEGRRLTLTPEGVSDERGGLGGFGFHVTVRRRRGWLQHRLTPAKEHSALVNRAYLAPLNLTVDSRELQPQRPGSNLECYTLCGRGRGFQVWQDLRIPYLRNPKGAYEHVQTRVYRDQNRIVERPTTENFYCDLLISAPYYTHPGRGEVRFVKDGVLTSRHVLDDFPEALMVADAEGLKTDLSEFQMVEDDAFRERIEKLKRQCLWTLPFGQS